MSRTERKVPRDKPPRNNQKRSKFCQSGFFRKISGKNRLFSKKPGKNHPAPTGFFTLGKTRKKPEKIALFFGREFRSRTPKFPENPEIRGCRFGPLFLPHLALRPAPFSGLWPDPGRTLDFDPQMASRQAPRGPPAGPLADP